MSTQTTAAASRFESLRCQVGDRVIIGQSRLPLVIGRAARIVAAVPKGRWVVALVDGPVTESVPVENFTLKVREITIEDANLILISRAVDKTHSAAADGSDEDVSYA